MKHTLSLVLLCLFHSILFAQAPFTPVKYTPDNKTLVIPEEYEYSILFRENDYVYTSPNQKAYAKKNHDYIAFIPGAKKNEAQLYLSHETNDSSTVLGDGGGGTIFSIKNNKGEWSREGAFYNIDFKNVGGTYDNCGGLYVPETNRILTAEEMPPENNKALHKNGQGTRDTSNFNTLQRYEQMGWMVEVDPSSRKALRKLYALGRYSHESACLSKDGKTLYMTDDHSPSVLFKFIASTPFQFDQGTLYAYDQNRIVDPWIPLPAELDSLLVIRDIALRKGATVFLRMEWMTLVNEKIYITETGNDQFNLQDFNITPHQVAHHLKTKTTDGVISYPYGALLELNLNTQCMRVVVNGGTGTKDPSKHFSNPDAITHQTLNGKTWLIMCEDLIGKDKQRVLSTDGEAKAYTNEIWWLDTSIPNAKVDDLQRFLVAVPGAECTGVCFSPDGETLFVNIQHPSPSNAYPFEKSCTIVLRKKMRLRDKKKSKQRPQDGFGVSIPF
jgi:uncharacterized protein